MNDGFMLNREGKIIGRFDGNWLREGTGKLVARHDESENRTRDRNGKIVGSGGPAIAAIGAVRTP